MEYDVNDTSIGLQREHEALSWLRTHDPVHWDPKNEAWLLTRHADVREVLRRPRVWSSARGLFVARHMNDARSSIITMDDPHHARYRKLLSRAFTPRAMQLQNSQVGTMMDDAIDALADRRACDFVSALAVPLPMRMIAAMLGFDDADPHEFSRLSDALIEAANAGPDDIALLERSVDAVSVLREHTRRAIVDRRRKAGADLLSVLLEGVDAGILHTSDDPGEDDVFQFAFLLVVAGNETTRHTISWGAHALLTNPGELERVRTAPEISLAVEECIRWASILRGLKRTALEDTEIGRQKIRRGEQVILLYPSANRDETVFDQPFEFRAGRSPNDHIAFGEGSHYCLGANLARLEVQTALRQIFGRLPGLRLDPTVQMTPKLTPILNGIGHMGVVYDSAKRREPSA